MSVQPCRSECADDHRVRDGLQSGDRERADVEPLCQTLGLVALGSESRAALDVLFLGVTAEA